jgi:hypothetical protein
VRDYLILLVEAVGAVLVVAGVAQWSPALACVVAGGAMIAFGETR